MRLPFVVFSPSMLQMPFASGGRNAIGREQPEGRWPGRAEGAPGEGRTQRMTDSVEHHPPTHHRAALAHVARAPALACDGAQGVARAEMVLSASDWNWAALTVAFALVLALWWRLNNGPIEFDVATPVAESSHSGELRRETHRLGRRYPDRADGERRRLCPAARCRRARCRRHVVASAPKAEIGISGTGLLTGHLMARSLNLVGAETAIRIEPDGRLTVFAGADKRPIVSAAVPPKPQAPASPDAGGAATASPTDEAAAHSGGLQEFAAILGWIDNLGETGLDGQELREVGLKNGRLTVDDRRNGRQLNFDHINVSLTRPRQGGLMFKLESGNKERPWIINAAIRPLGEGVRALGIEARNVSIRDLLLPMRMNDPAFSADFPISASIRSRHRARRNAATRQRRVGRRRWLDRQPRQSRRRCRHRSRAGPFQLGRSAAHFNRAVPNPLRWKSIHVARQCRAADRARERVGGDDVARRSGH